MREVELRREGNGTPVQDIHFYNQCGLIVHIIHYVPNVDPGFQYNGAQYYECIYITFNKITSIKHMSKKSPNFAAYTYLFIYLFIYLLNIFKQGRTFRQKHCFTMLPCKDNFKIRQ